MKNNKIYIKNVEEINNNLKITLYIYDEELPEFTIENKVIPAMINEETKEVLTEETIEEIQILRKEYQKVIYVPFNYPIEQIEDMIKGEVNKFSTHEEEVEEKMNYFKDKIY